MKRKEVKELPNKTAEELKKMLDELHVNYAKTQLDLKLGRSKNTAVLKDMKRDVARIMTVLNIKEREDKANG